MLLLRYSILLAIGIVLGASRASEAQENRVIQGRVVDAADNAPLPGAIIVAISVDGTPVNMVSHAHGQGYADLHFLIPEIVSRVEVRKGPYDARDGDHATAATGRLTPRRITAGTTCSGSGRCR